MDQSEKDLKDDDSGGHPMVWDEMDDAVEMDDVVEMTDVMDRLYFA